MASLVCQTVGVSAAILSSPVSFQKQTVISGQKLSLKVALRRSTRGARLVVRAASPQVGEDIGEKIAAATEVCKEGTTGECAAAWDEIEEISAEAADKKLRLQTSSDPLDAFCAENPETDECRVYED